MIWRLFIVVLCMAGSGVLRGQTDISLYKIERGEKMISLAFDTIQNVLDVGDTLSIEDFVEQRVYLESASGGQIFSAAPHARWLAFRFEKEPEEQFRQYLLQLGNAHIAHFDLYFVEGDQVLKHLVQGDNYVFSNREIPHNYFLHNIPETTGNIVTCYIRVDNEGQEVSVPILIERRSEFIKGNAQEKLFHGFVIGLFLITALITIILYFVYRERFYLWESVVSVCSVLYILSEEGYGMMLFWPNYPPMNGYSRPLFFGLVVIFGLLFTLEFLRQDHWDKIWTRLSQASVWLFGLFMLLVHPMNLLGWRTQANAEYLIMLFLILSFLICVGTAVIAYYSWRYDKSRNGMIVFLVFMATVISVLIRMLAIQGMGTHSNFTIHTGFITRGIHVPLIGGYLVYRAIVDSWERNRERLVFLEERQQMSKALIENVDTERQRISMALHDSAGSIITGIKANLESGMEVSTNKQYFEAPLKLTDRLQQEIRNICNDLLPNTITKIGIVPEIKRLLSDIESTYGLKTVFQTNVESREEVPDSILIHIYYIVRESLDNIVKYAECENILIQYFCYPGDEILLIIEDDGKGFDLKKVKEAGLGHGLQNMAQRVHWLKGNIDFYTNEEGTSISINMPI